MTSKSHTKPIFYTFFKAITSSKNISRHSLLAVLFTLFTCITSMTTAQAELFDLSSSEPAIQFPMYKSYWSIMPSFKINEDSLSCLKEDTTEVINEQILAISLKLLVDESGNITQVEVVESSGNKCLDRSSVQQVKLGRFRPFMKNGKAVLAQVTLPIKFEVP